MQSQGKSSRALRVTTVLRGLPEASLPYSATILGLKIVPLGLLLNAETIYGFVTRMLLSPGNIDEIGCVYVSWFDDAPLVTLNATDLREEA